MAKGFSGWGGMAGKKQHYYHDYGSGLAICGHVSVRIYIPDPQRQPDDPRNCPHCAAMVRALGLNIAEEGDRDAD